MGQVLLDSKDINDASQDPVLLRMKVGNGVSKT